MYELQKLSYAYNALEPIIDAATMEIHHSKHHQTYVNNFNKALENYPDLQTKTPEEIIKDLDSLPVIEADKSAIKNHGGGVVNHNFFWQIMNPALTKDENLEKEIIETFGSVEAMKTKFSETALKHFGSGWTWLVRNSDNKLEIYATANQDSPLAKGHTPLLTIDVWEHAYYLKYQNRRQEYIEAWWQLIKFI
ncbi:MAG: superoxide dismutase [Patescibacteria group bacterium]|nr:superoxide dismutase [Patescibacteria group bacterium]